MPNTKDLFGEDVLLLYPDDYDEKFNKFALPSFERPIIKGAASQLRRWPSDLFYAFVAACIIIGSLICLIFVTLALCLPNIVDSRAVKNIEIEESPNVYFLKLKNRTWSTREFCYIETAARRHPDVNVYLINLLDDEPDAGKDMTIQIKNKTRPESKFSYLMSDVNDSLKLSPEEQLRNRLMSRNANVRNIDVSIERFFRGSKLSEVARSLNDGILEMAAGAQLLWNSPGIVLNPRMHCHLKTMEQFLCKNKESCPPDILATIEPENDIQATGVPCQAFIGFLMHEIAKNKLDQPYTLKKAVERFCPRPHHCPEVRIIDLKMKCPVDELNCPTVYSSIILEDDELLENSIT